MNTPALLCGAAEIALNRYLRLEPAVLEDCAKLHGRWIEFTLRGPDLVLALEFMPDGVRVVGEAAQKPDVRIVGTPTALIGALRHVNGDATGIPAGLVVEGDVELLDRFGDLIRRVGFDPAEWLAPVLGGAAAHRLVGGLRRAFDWTRSNGRRMADHGAEYLREESYDLARGRDVAEWMHEVDDARDALERLEARLRRLEGTSRSTGAP
jgi:ubiquinone biosynthesis accessory factor UbiJ